MRLGLIARCDWTGLGVQTRDYYRHLKPHRTLIVDISMHNGMEQHFDWYDGAMVSHDFPRRELITEFLRGLDVVLTAETPYNFQLYKMAREMGVKTVCVENPEFYDHIIYPEFPLPDMMILPSVWKEQEIRAHAESKGVKVVQLHHPVDRNEFPVRVNSEASFFHIAGKPAAHDRNGTWDFLYSCPDGTVITQSSDLAFQIGRRYRHTRIVKNVDDNKTMYSFGSVLVLPRKYGGNCLPLNEALSSGVPVIMPDIEPNNHLLPPEWLVPAHKVDTFEPRTPVDIYEVDHDALVAKLEWFRNCNMTEQCYKADEIANTISWKALKPKYMEVLESLCVS